MHASSTRLLAYWTNFLKATLGQAPLRQPCFSRLVRDAGAALEGRANFVQCGDHDSEHDDDISLNSHTSSLQPDDRSIGSMLDSATSDEVGTVSVEPTPDDDPSISDTSTMSLLANDDDGEPQHQDTGVANGPQLDTIHDADSGSGSGGGAHLASVPQLSTPDYNDTHFPHPDLTYRRSDGNMAAVALSLPHDRLCSTNNCKRFSRFAFTDFEWPACCTLCYSQGSSSHSSTCDAAQGTCTTRGCQRRLSSDPLVGWHPAGERFCCADCINTAGARHSATCDEVSRSATTSSATVPFRPVAVLPLTLLLSPLPFVPRVLAVVLSTLTTIAHGMPNKLRDDTLEDDSASALPSPTSPNTLWIGLKVDVSGELIADF